jgi:poly(3-hydroxybutyrate) depolymerase
LIKGLSQRLCIDKERIYAAGLGTGGGLAHLLACDPQFSDVFTAFAAINPTVFAGVIDRRAVKDEITLMWEKCKPARIPIRFLEIHSENNTINNYWGKAEVKDKKHRRMPIVQWLVEWAIRNECGPAMGNPEKEKPEDIFYLTELEGGTIQEGIVVPDRLQKATYKCHERSQEEMVANFLKSLNLDSVQSMLDKQKKENGEEETTEEKAGDIKAAKEEVLQQLSGMDKPKKERGVLCLVHYFLKNYGHGWPRVFMKNGTTEAIGPDDVATDDAPIFDATFEVLDWFSQNKHSDEFRAPNPEPGDPQLDQDSLGTLLGQLGDDDEVDEKEQIEKELNEEQQATEAMEDLEASTEKATNSDATSPAKEKDEL